MKKVMSKFNIYEWEKDTVIIYNSYSGGVLGLNEDYAKKFKLMYDEGKFEEQLDDDLQQALKAGAMIVDEETDEVEAIRIQSNIARFGNEATSFTIAPTLECNFRCPYCYENGKRYNTMNDEVIERTIEFVNANAEGRNKTSIAWYGGEPLLRMDIIERITNGIKNRENYSAQIVTNGYYLTEENAKKLKELDVVYAQVTIDGPPEIHNKRRRLPNGEDTFFVILNNIKAAADYIHITIRVNVDKSNMDKADRVLDYINEYGLSEKVGIYLAPVDAVNESCNAPNCYTDMEFAIEQMEFTKRNQKRGFNFVDLPNFNPSVCGAVSSSCFIIDPLGDLYKCWDHVGYKEESVGSIFDEGIDLMKSTMVKWLGYEIAQYEECKECKVLPICMGGCPYKKLRKREMSCDSIRYNANGMIQLLKLMTMDGVEHA